MRRMLKEMLILALGTIAVIYLLNPGWGVLEFIPDNAPLIGNLDEAGAMFILVNVLRYYGFDVSSLWNREDDKRKNLPPGAHEVDDYQA